MDKKIRVFISYAWESPEFRQRVWDFAGWLHTASNGTIEPISDHLYSNRPPAEGWQVWMQNQIIQSDIILVICTPKYYARFQKKEPLNGSGLGVAFEGAIITTEFYQMKGVNEKIFPIRPDDSTTESVPIILQPYDNGHTFPANNDKILCLINNENPKHGAGVSKVDTEEKMSEEKEIVIEAIAVTGKKQEDSIMTTIQITVRSFLSLDEPSKEVIIRKLNINISPKDYKNAFEKDKATIINISSSKRLSEFWEAINELQPFEDPINPFKNR